jgi:hypothetical protein
MLVRIMLMPGDIPVSSKGSRLVLYTDRVAYFIVVP